MLAKTCSKKIKRDHLEIGQSRIHMASAPPAGLSVNTKPSNKKVLGNTENILKSKYDKMINATKTS